jgi:hypothetical protein
LGLELQASSDLAYRDAALSRRWIQQLWPASISLSPASYPAMSGASPVI